MTGESRTIISLNETFIIKEKWDSLSKPVGQLFRYRFDDSLMLGVEPSKENCSFDSPLLQSLTGRALLTRSLQEQGVLTNPPIYRYGKYGKPYLTNYPDCYFNIAHCRRAVVCIVSPREVGIDVEEIRDDITTDLMNYVLNETEQASILTSPTPERTFIRWWTMKESLLKYNGTGLTDDLKNILVEEDPKRFRFFSGPDYEITVCLNERV